MLFKRIDDSKQKKRRCFLKESTMLKGSSQYTLRYHLTAMYREVEIRDKPSKIIAFPYGFSWSFLSVAFLSLWIHPEQHSRLGRIRKRYLFFRWDSVPLWELLWFFEPSMPREGSMFSDIPQLAQWIDRVIQKQYPVNFYWAIKIMLQQIPYLDW